MSTLVRDAAYGKPTQELDTTVKPEVRILNGVMDNDKASPAGVIVQGRLDPATLRFLKTDDYQRKVEQRSDIWQALRDGTVLPNVEIGVRGEDFEVEGKHGLVIRSPSYIVDGQQRIGNALMYLDTNPQALVRLNATIHFNTTRAWERKRFDDLNLKRKKVSPNHHLRNMRDDNRAILTLFGLCNTDKSSPLYERVSWDQNMRRGDLMTAMTIAVVACELHSNLVKVRSRTADVMGVQLLALTEAIGLQMFRRNILTFFALIDGLWPFADITNRFGAPHIKTTFMVEVAHMFARHAIFWEKDDKELVVSADDRKKLSKFPIHDPAVRSLAGGGGASRLLMYQMLLQHMNSGRRQHRLVSRKDAALDEKDDE